MADCQNRTVHGTEMTSDDIVTRLRLGTPTAVYVVAQDAADEIERLQEQVAHAHAILASEGAAWLVVGSNHEWAWRQALTPAIQAYWARYGSYFKEAHRG